MNKVLKWICTHWEKESRILWKELWKSYVNKRNFCGVFLVTCIYICIKFVRIKAFFHYFCSCHQKENLIKIIKMILFYQRNSFYSWDFQIFVFPSSLLFTFLGHCCFYIRSWLMISSKSYGQDNGSKLAFKNKDSLISDEVKFWSWYLLMGIFGSHKSNFGSLHSVIQY